MLFLAYVKALRIDSVFEMRYKNKAALPCLALPRLSLYFFYGLMLKESQRKLSLQFSCEPKSDTLVDPRWSQKVQCLLGTAG